MRDNYPYCFLIGDGSLAFKEICRSLRFSTHCNYIILSPEVPFEISAYIFMQWNNIDTFNVDEFLKEEELLYISCSENIINFGKFKSQKEFELILSNCKNSTENISNYENIVEELKKGMLLSDEKFSKLFLDYDVDKFNLDFLIDYEGCLNFLSGTIIYKNGSYRLIENDLHCSIQSNSLIQKNKNKDNNKIISLAVSRSGNIDLNENIIHSGWMILRSIGINIPLIIVQNLLKRKIKTFYFLNANQISYDEQSNKIKYKFSFDCLYFDLDETLIWKGIPNKNLIKLLILFHKEKFSIKLITRHKLSIYDTLNKIGLDENFFDEIIKITAGQKKSSFIRGNSVFIDNEFPERLDVLLNCSIPALDLDQIDFINEIRYD